jgi:coenzyme Q-binding protein COQ10
MPKSRQRKILYYSAKDLFDIVLDIESYPYFIPWCTNARIISKEKDNIIAGRPIKAA